MHRYATVLTHANGTIEIAGYPHLWQAREVRDRFLELVEAGDRIDVVTLH